MVLLLKYLLLELKQTVVLKMHYTTTYSICVLGLWVSAGPSCKLSFRFQMRNIGTFVGKNDLRENNVEKFYLHV